MSGRKLTVSDTLDQLRRVYEEALSLAATKNIDYGDAWRDQGWRGNISRVFEKAKRLRTLLWRSQAQPALVRETSRETAIDMINTLAFFIINHDAGVEWGDEIPFARTTAPMAPKDHLWETTDNPWVEQNGTVLPSSVEIIREGLNPLLDTDPRGIEIDPELPVRVPGEEAPVETPRPGRKKPGPLSRTLPPR